ncbi:TerB family tellurite resistance protein [Chondromyces crocatus]|nr:TerB family tellurite resistance protein [Chondromyces crocatus]
MVELMYLAASADGEFSEEERAHFLKSVESLTDRQLGADAVKRVVDALEGKLRNSDRHERLLSIRERLGTAALCKVAFSLAIAVMAADGIIRTSEREALLEMATALQLDRDEAANLVAKHAS